MKLLVNLLISTAINAMNVPHFVSPEMEFIARYAPGMAQSIANAPYTVLHPIQPIVFCKEIRDKRNSINFLKSEKVQDLLKTPGHRIELYNYISWMVPSLFNPKALVLIREWALEDFPKEIHEASYILSFGMKHQKLIDILVETPAFKKFIQDRKALEEVVEGMHAFRPPILWGLVYETPPFWNNILPKLDKRLGDLWVKDIINGEKFWTMPEFGKYVDRPESPGFLHEQLIDAQMPPKIWSRISCLQTLRRLTSTTKLSKVVEDLTDIYMEGFLDLLDYSPVYLEILKDPFKSFRLNSMLKGDVLTDPHFENLKVAARRKYIDKLDVLKSLRDPTPFDWNEFDKLGDFKPYQKYIANHGRATNLLIEIKAKPETYQTFMSNEQQMKILKVAAYSHLVTAE
jgi:hypothetical protein